LPERARTSGLIPRHRTLDERIDTLITEYLTVLDKFPLAAKMKPTALVQCQQAFRHLEPRMRGAAGHMEQFQTQYATEFQRVAIEVGKVEQQKGIVTAALRQAQAVWQEVRSQGFESRAPMLHWPRPGSRAVEWSRGLPNAAFRRCRRRWLW
jgi:hypothetical protein